MTAILLLVTSILRRSLAGDRFFYFTIKVYLCYITEDLLPSGKEPLYVRSFKVEYYQAEKGRH